MNLPEHIFEANFESIRAHVHEAFGQTPKGGHNPKKTKKPPSATKTEAAESKPPDPKSDRSKNVGTGGVAQSKEELAKKLANEGHSVRDIVKMLVEGQQDLPGVGGNGDADLRRQLKKIEGDIAKLTKAKAPTRPGRNADANAAKLADLEKKRDEIKGKLK